MIVNVAQFKNWITDLKSAFDADPSKFPTSRQKVILATMTLDETLKTSYNSSSLAFPAISRHWRKFKRWAQDVVLHGNSDRQKLSFEYTIARQRFGEDPNQFYLRLFNLGIQAGRQVDVEDYRTRLLRPLQNLLIQHDRTYPTMHDMVAHAARLWLTLDTEKLRRDFNEEKQRKREERSRKPKDSQQPSRSGQASQRRRQNHDRKDGTSSSNSPRLSESEEKHRRDNNLCFNCGYPGHHTRECEHRFNPNRANRHQESSKNKTQEPAKTQATRKRAFARSQPVQVEDNDQESDHGDITSEDEDLEPPRKKSKN